MNPDDLTHVPCPFCGHTSPILQGQRSLWLKCSNDDCGGQGPVRSNAEAAGAAWNLRGAALAQQWAIGEITRLKLLIYAMSQTQTQQNK